MRLCLLDYVVLQAVPPRGATEWIVLDGGLHPLAVIFALLAFAQVFGFFGVLVALPSSAVLLVALRRQKRAYFESAFYGCQ